jgi:hypothetical protein
MAATSFRIVSMRVAMHIEQCIEDGTLDLKKRMNLVEIIHQVLTMDTTFAPIVRPTPPPPVVVVTMPPPPPPTPKAPIHVAPRRPLSPVRKRTRSPSPKRHRRRSPSPRRRQRSPTPPRRHPVPFRQSQVPAPKRERSRSPVKHDPPLASRCNFDSKTGIWYPKRKPQPYNNDAQPKPRDPVPSPITVSVSTDGDKTRTVTNGQNEQLPSVSVAQEAADAKAIDDAIEARSAAEAAFILETNRLAAEEAASDCLDLFANM